MNVRPIKLEITGLQSFSEKQTINFDELTSMGIFGIFGETGSGKSTILDAMIFSIFDQIPRTMGSNGKNIRSSLNSDSNILEVYFKFCLGEDIFEITRIYKKKYNRKGEEKFEQSNPIMIKNNDVIADTVKNVETKVKEYFGIGVNDFTRSVVLPQGKFSDFLKLKGAEKMTMLENIFDLDKYGTKIAEKISSRLSKIKENITQLENQIVGKGDFSPELMLDLEDSLKSKGLEHDFVTIEKNSVQSNFLEMSNIKTLSEKLDFYNSELSRLENSKIEVDSYSEKLKKHELSSLFKVTLDELEVLRNDISVAENEVIYLENSFRESSCSLEKFKNEEVEKKLNLDSLDSLLKSLKIDYDELEALRKCEGYLNTLALKEKMLAETIITFENENSEYSILKDKFENNKDILITQKLYLENLVDIDKDSIHNLESEIEVLKNKISTFYRELNQKISYEDSLNGYIESKDRYILDLEIILQDLALVEEKSRDNKAFELSKALLSGKECPVCGSKEHPNKAKNSVDVDLNLLNELLKAEADTKKIIFELDVKIDYSKEKLSEFQNLENIENLENDYILKEDALKNLKDAEKEFDLKSKDTLSKIAVLESTISNIHDNILQKEKSLQIIKDKIELYKGEVLVERENISFLNLEDSSLESIVQRKLYLDSLDKDYRANISMKNSFEIELRDVKDKILESSGKVAEITLNLSRTNESVKNYKDSFNKKNENFEKELFDAGFKSYKQINDSILNSFEIENMKNAIESYSNDFVKYNHLKDEILTSLDGKVFEKESWNDLNLELKNLNLKSEALVKEITEISSHLERIQKLAHEAKDLLSQINSLITKEDELLLLQKKFKGRKFVNFLARKRLDYIAYEASKRLKKITKGRYLLNVDKYCDFNIVDAFNSNHVRDCSTLSGGETFIVSLVLALALSSQLQLKGNIQLEFFFLDEGFGTLDTTLLDRVIEVLEEIRWKDKMKIGIISHVEDLKIRIPRRLEVSPAIPGERGSLVKLI